MSNSLFSSTEPETVVERTLTLFYFRTFWDRYQLTRDVSRRDFQSSKFEIELRDSFEDKFRFIGVPTSLKVSLLSGLIDVDGSASYVNDNKLSKSVARVTLKYHAETYFEQLTQAHFNKDHIRYPEVFDDSEATHVVVGKFLQTFC